jgi:hypothetical protein
VPIVFAAGRLPGLALEIGIAEVSIAGYFGFLAGPPLIGLVAAVVGLMALGGSALERRASRATALAG